MPSITGLLETALFVNDLDHACAFYAQVLGLRKVSHGDRGCNFLVAENQLLLLVKQGVTVTPNVTPGGTVPPCGATGSAHIAFAIPVAALDDWRRHLTDNGVTILSEVAWPRGGRSLYFHDPDGHLLELATPGVWEVF